MPPALNGPENPLDIAVWLKDHGYHVADITLTDIQRVLMREGRIVTSGHPFAGESIWSVP